MLRDVKTFVDIDDTYELKFSGEYVDIILNGRRIYLGIIGKLFASSEWVAVSVRDAIKADLRGTDILPVLDTVVTEKIGEIARAHLLRYLGVPTG